MAKQGLGANGIASWLTSTDGRHLMDDVNRKTPAAKFKRRAMEYTKNAAHNVAVWSHPDHDGSMSGSNRVREHLTNLFGGNDEDK